MRKYQIWESSKAYAISDFRKTKLEFSTIKNFSAKFLKHAVLETETATKPAFKKYLLQFFSGHGVHPIFNPSGKQVEQIVNVPNRVLSSEEILKYLNDYTILDQETPPYEEIIYRLACYSEVLTEEYYDIKKISYDESDLVKLFLEDRTEDDIDKHYFITAPKSFEEKRGTIFHLPKPNRAHRKWIILDEYYDFKKNAFIDPENETISKREGKRIEIADKKKEVTKEVVKKAVDDFLAEGKKITKLDPVPETEFDWTELAIHHLAHIIPFPTDAERERLKEDIRLNGVLEKIVLFEGKVLDGRTRHGICLELGIKPEYRKLPSEINPRIYVISMGIQRRHLTSSQIAAFGVEELLPEFEKEAKKRQQLRSADNGTEKIQYHNKGTASEHLAAFLKTNDKYIYDAKKIKESSPETFGKILSGELTISAAKRQIKPHLFIKKKAKIRTPFEKQFRFMLNTVMDRSVSNNGIKASSQAYVVMRSISMIYLEWNKRNDKKVIRKLEELKSEFADIFEEKPKRHLHLLEM